MVQPVLVGVELVSDHRARLFEKLMYLLFSYSLEPHLGGAAGAVPAFDKSGVGLGA